MTQRLLSSDFYDVPLKEASTYRLRRRARLYQFSNEQEIRALLGPNGTGDGTFCIGDLLLWKSAQLLFIHSNASLSRSSHLFFNESGDNTILPGFTVFSRNFKEDRFFELFLHEPSALFSDQIDSYYDLIVKEPAFANTIWTFKLNLHNGADPSFERHFGHAPLPGWKAALVTVHAQQLVDLYSIHVGTNGDNIVDIFVHNQMPSRSHANSLTWRDIVEIYYEMTDTTVMCLAMIYLETDVLSRLERELAGFLADHACTLTYLSVLLHEKNPDSSSPPPAAAAAAAAAEGEDEGVVTEVVHHIQLVFETRLLAFNTVQFEARLCEFLKTISATLRLVNFCVKHVSSNIVSLEEFRHQCGMSSDALFANSVLSVRQWQIPYHVQWYSQHARITRLMLMLMPRMPLFSYGGFYYRQILLLIDENFDHIRPARFIGLVDGLLGSYRRVLDARTKHTHLRSGRLLPKMIGK